MSSGFGIDGGQGRCYPFWQEFKKCHMQADSNKECIFQFEDYLECLHHRKEVFNFNKLARLDLIRKECTKQSLKDSANK